MKKRFAKIHIEKGIKKCLAVIMAGAVVVTGGVLPQGKMVSAAADYGISNPRVENGVTTWDKIKFGSYYQDVGFESEPIKWRVLSVDGDDAFLLADQIIDCKAYNDKDEDVTWETCTLRKWLNEDFYDEAFDEEEKDSIIKTNVVNNDTIDTDEDDGFTTEAGNDTIDNIYLLSLDEVKNVSYRLEEISPIAYNTDYVDLEWDTSEWWMRSPGENNDYASYVNKRGWIYEEGNRVDNNYGIRPVLHVNLSSSKVQDAGEVDSEGNITCLEDGIHAPRLEYYEDEEDDEGWTAVATWDCVYFGNYKQHGGKRQDIEWRVLSVNGDDAFLLADMNLYRKYIGYGENDTWETCELRKWLNQDFYNEAFDYDEKNAVIETNVANNDTTLDDGSIKAGGNDTRDKVYLLSIDEATNAAYGFSTDLNDDSETRYAKNTAYAIFKGAYTDYSPENDCWWTGNGYWWLRSPSEAMVTTSGNIDVDGYWTREDACAVRPALHINLSSSVWSKAGEVTSDGKEEMSKPTNQPTVNEYGISNPRVEYSEEYYGVNTTWDKIKFGSYYQDAEFEPEPIKWRVLSVDGDDAFLLADRNLDAKPYSESEEYYDEEEDEYIDESPDVTWETCTLREWLNEDFYNEAFDAEEKAAISETTVINNDTISVNYEGEEKITEGGNDTKDKIYLLSIDEASNVSYGFDSELGKYSETRYAKNTDYLKLNNISENVDWWWLRSPGRRSDYASSVFQGYGDDQGNGVGSSYAVRPVLHVNLSSSKVQDAGEVDSKGNVTDSEDGIHAPRVEYCEDDEGDITTVTTWDCVYFGSYKQTAKWKKQEIEWRVLSVNDNDAFLLADKAIYSKSYNEGKNKDVTWETCTLRKWLNEDFYNEAFDEDDKNAILETNVDNSYTVFGENYIVEGGNDTKDKLYLLSADEVTNTEYGFDPWFYGESDTRYAKNTQYAIVNGAYSESGYGRWWLRCPSYNCESASYVDCDGYGYNGFDYGDSSIGVVRPVLHIDLSSSVWSKSGEVSSGEWEDEPVTTEAPTPTQTKEPTETPTEKPEQKPDAPQGQPTETPVPPSNGIGNTPPDINNANVPSVGNTNIAVQPPAAAKILSAKNTKKGKVVIKWNKSAYVNGYEIQYSNNKKFKKAKKKSTSKNKYTIKKLKKKKVYYIRLRAYKVVNGAKLYGSWSKPKKIKIKK